MIYKSPFTRDVEVNTKEEARKAILQMCAQYCNKDAIGKLHCSGRDAALCNAVKNKIAEDFCTTNI